jgi:hypothetical protein
MRHVTSIEPISPVERPTLWREWLFCSHGLKPIALIPGAAPLATAPGSPEDGRIDPRQRHRIDQRPPNFGWAVRQLSQRVTDISLPVRLCGPITHGSSPRRTAGWSLSAVRTGRGDPNRPRVGRRRDWPLPGSGLRDPPRSGLCSLALPVRPIARLAQGQEPGQPGDAAGASGAVVTRGSPTLHQPPLDIRIAPAAGTGVVQ